VDGSVFDTDGFPIVSASERGSSTSTPPSSSATSTRKPTTPVGFGPGILPRGYFSEDRVNAKVGEVNDTRWTSVSGGVRAALPDRSELQATLFGDIEKFHSTFLAVTAPSATVAAEHHPVDGRSACADECLRRDGAVGQSAEHAQLRERGHGLSLVDGESQEDSFNAAPERSSRRRRRDPRAAARVRRTQRSAGVYAQDVMTPVSNLTVTASARVDTWRNYNPHNLETAVIAGTVVSTGRPARPRAECRRRASRIAAIRPSVRELRRGNQATGWLSVWGDIGGGFRAPTLNELYRQFRVGTVLTTANDQLGPERLVGGEAGLSLTPVRDVTIRTTWFDNHVTNPGVECDADGRGGERHAAAAESRETQIWGIQSDVEYRVGAAFKLSAGYLYNQATITDGGTANAALLGKFLPQVPVHRGSLRAIYTNPRVVTVSADVLFFGRQFDDDQNTRGIPRRR